MSTALAGAGQMIDPHLDPKDIAAYVERAATGERRARIEAHLARCAECRDEVSESSHLVHALRARRGWRGGVFGAAAAAALLLVFLWPRKMPEPAVPAGHARSVFEPVVSVEHRGGPPQAATAPRPISPVGSVDSVTSITWSAVREAKRYRVRVFSADGTLLWEKETADTSLATPASPRLQAGRSYFWRVDAETALDRRVGSDLIEFVPRHGARP